MRKVTSLQRVFLLIAVGLVVVGAASIRKRDKRHAGITGQWTSDNGYKRGTTYDDNVFMRKVIDTGANGRGSPEQYCVVIIDYETDIEDSLDCTYDKLILNVRGQNETTVCGKSKDRKKITVPEGKMVILEFHSDQEEERQGFKLNYTVSCQDTEVPSGRIVGGRNASGLFKCPEDGSPKYSPNQDLTYRYLTTGSTIYIEYEVDIEADDEGLCPFDYLLIHTVNGDVELCGHDSGNMIINVENNELVARFHTDRDGNYKGFKVFYKVVDPSSSLPRGGYPRQGGKFGRSRHFRGSAHKPAYDPHEQFLSDQIENSNSFFPSGQNQNSRTNDFPLPYDWNQGIADNRFSNGQIDNSYPSPLLEENQNLGANFPSPYDQIQRTVTNRLLYDLIKKLNAHLETDEKQATTDNRWPYDPRPYNRNQGIADNRFPNGQIDNSYPSPLLEENQNLGANFRSPHDQIQTNGINPLPYKLIQKLNAYLETDEKEAVTRKPLPYGLLKKLNAYLETDEKQAVMRKPLPYGLLKKLNAYLETDEKQVTTDDSPSYDLIDGIKVFYPTDEKQATTDDPLSYDLIHDIKVFYPTDEKQATTDDPLSYDLIHDIKVFYPTDEKQATTDNRWPYDPRPYNRNQGIADNRFPNGQIDNSYPSPPSEENQNSGVNFPFSHDQIRSIGINPLPNKLIKKLNAHLETDEKQATTDNGSPYDPRPYNRNQGIADNHFPNRYPSPPSEENLNSGVNFPSPHDQIQGNGINPLPYNLIQKLNAYLETDEKEAVTSKLLPYNPIENLRVFFSKDEK